MDLKAARAFQNDVVDCIGAMVLFIYSTDTDKNRRISCLNSDSILLFWVNNFAVHRINLKRFLLCDFGETLA